MFLQLFLNKLQQTTIIATSAKGITVLLIINHLLEMTMICIFHHVSDPLQMILSKRLIITQNDLNTVYRKITN